MRYVTLVRLDSLLFWSMLPDTDDLDAAIHRARMASDHNGLRYCVVDVYEVVWDIATGSPTSNPKHEESTRVSRLKNLLKQQECLKQSVQGILDAMLCLESNTQLMPRGWRDHGEYNAEAWNDALLQIKKLKGTLTTLRDALS